MELSGYFYQCSAGETFDIVALYIYGDGKYAAELMGANPKYATLSVFTGEEMLALPVVEIPESTGENEYTPSAAPWKE